MSNLIDGKKVAGEIKDEISKVISESISRGNRAPSIKIVLVGDHGPSKIYVNAKLKACESVGIEAKLISLNDNINQDDLSELIADMNIDQDLDGFIVQLPLLKSLLFSTSPCSLERMTLQLIPVSSFHFMPPSRAQHH